jgi:rare lipoprotein A
VKSLKSILLSFGILLSPTVNAKEYQVGIASYYGKQHHGKKTASGAIFNMFAMTAAHRFLKLGTKLKVVNLKNHKSVMVTITDRGPYIRGRIIDLSFGAAKSIGITGLGQVSLELQ